MLSNGDKVIGDVGCYDEDRNFHVIYENKLCVKNPFILREIMNQEGFTIVPFPLLPSDDETVYINENHIMVYPCDPKEDIVDMYRQITSNILIPKRNKIQMM
jgi:hypothetical protein